MNRMLRITGAALVLVLGGCATDLTASEYARKAASEQAEAARAAQTGDRDKAAELERQAQADQRRAAERQAQENYEKQHDTRDLNPKSLPAPDNLPPP